MENVEDLQYINSNKKNLELIETINLISIKDVRNYAFLLVYFTEDQLRAYVKTSIDNKKIDKNFNIKTYPDDKEKTYREAIVTIKQEINQIWKGQNLIDVNTPAFLDLFLEVEKMNDYLKLSNILDSIDSIENYSVLEMTNKYLKIRLKYKGKVNRLRNKLLENNINIKIIDDIWRAKIN